MNVITIHPTIYTIYYIILILFALLFNNIYYLVAFLVFIVILLFLQKSKKEIKPTLKYFIPMSLIIIILNPLFSHVGTTKIFLMGNYFITLESLAYGFLMDFSLLIILLLFVSFNKYVDYQKLLYLTSNHFPNVSMIVVMVMRFIPLLNYRLGEVNKIFDFEHGNSDESKIDKIKKMGSILAVVIFWSLEESMLTAKSMKARGYGIFKRSSYLRYKINRIDIILIGIIMLCAIISLLGLYYGIGNVEIYPTLTPSFFNFPLDFPLNVFYLTFLVLLSPLIFLELKERVIWKLRSKTYGFN
ncbi:hypothetical protein ALNOE001_12190 [Candidatus Methanobinarius endosymbioticus]|uniref:Energy-coupling factor transporter transmembrane protein EcfT n=1 Tax=Candidatus Methanobinarius endosymbioticus TaxID=2006182 RepID=A0A366M9X0_9EURY|nr:hypothetical protein ALNOE001_12190 [Candidatus Methanobinarius endosymbioticus]